MTQFDFRIPKFYKNRQGKKVVVFFDDRNIRCVPVDGTRYYFVWAGGNYGKYGDPHPYDIVAEWKEPVEIIHYAVITSDGKVLVSWPNEKDAQDWAKGRHQIVALKGSYQP